MQFKSRKVRSKTPEVNLVPMMDVLMTVLTFFIIISMTLTGRPLVSVNAPQADIPADPHDRPQIPPLTIGLNQTGDILLADETPLTLDQLTREITHYLSEHPDGIVRLKADRTLDYREISEVLKIMRDIGGHRVSLAVE